jgi:lipopolysaccharide/colanic/teichoic acid biosynthesis glycosyltransferase
LRSKAKVLKEKSGDFMNKSATVQSPKTQSLLSQTFSLLVALVGLGVIASLPSLLANVAHATVIPFYSYLAQLFQTGSELAYNASKRLLDIVVAAAMLIFFAPVLLLVALAVKLDSRGPAVFKQTRVGAQPRLQNGRIVWEHVPFTCYKFRSMYTGADSARHQAFFEAFVKNDKEAMRELLGADANDDQALAFKMNNDPRITRMGRFIRKTSLDELPQLWNVLKGDMSLVGPRPAIQYEVEMYTSKHLQRLEAKQGLTGLWQVTGRSTVSFEEAMDLDIYYAQHKSLWMDIKIILETPVSVLASKGAK